MCESSTSWNSEAIAITLYHHSIDAWQNLGEKTLLFRQTSNKPKHDGHNS